MFVRVVRCVLVRTEGKSRAEHDEEHDSHLLTIHELKPALGGLFDDLQVIFERIPCVQL